MICFTTLSVSLFSHPEELLLDELFGKLLGFVSGAFMPLSVLPVDCGSWLEERVCVGRGGPDAKDPFLDGLAPSDCRW